MDNDVLLTNDVKLVGKVISDLKFSHMLMGEGFYTFILQSPRLSNQNDELVITISERIFPDLGEITIGTFLEINGQFRSYNQLVDCKNKLMLTVFVIDAKKLTEEDAIHNKNFIYLNGTICKKPVYRTTPFGREITDIMIAVNRSYKKSDYIPCIAWGRNARYAGRLEVGTKLQIWGRIQSKEYEKVLDNGEKVIKQAYEVSVSRLETVQ